jgi:hypothetical protein
VRKPLDALRDNAILPTLLQDVTAL